MKGKLLMPTMIIYGAPGIHGWHLKSVAAPCEHVSGMGKSTGQLITGPRKYTWHILTGPQNTAQVLKKSHHVPHHVPQRFHQRVRIII
jgi:hypothetical protein